MGANTRASSGETRTTSTGKEPKHRIFIEISNRQFSGKHLGHFISNIPIRYPKQDNFWYRGPFPPIVPCTAIDLHPGIRNLPGNIYEIRHNRKYRLLKHNILYLILIIIFKEYIFSKLANLIRMRSTALKKDNKWVYRKKESR